jgi:hypothetical protein
MLAESDEWGIDGTFCKPEDVMQRVVIVPRVPRVPGSSEKVPMTAAVAYTERRRAKDYERIFEAINNRLPPDQQRVPRWIVQGRRSVRRMRHSSDRDSGSFRHGAGDSQGS